MKKLFPIMNLEIERIEKLVEEYTINCGQG